MTRIYGIGTDIIQISRVAGVMERTQGRFAERILGPEELDKYHARAARSPARGLAAAISQAWSDGCPLLRLRFGRIATTVSS